MKRNVVLGALSALLLAASPLAAQEASPEALAAASNAATLRKDWRALAHLIDPDQLARVQSTFGRLLEMEPDAAILGMFGVDSHAAFLELAPQDVMLGFFEIAQVKQQMEAVEFIDGRVLGIVREGEDQAHAIVRQTMRVMGFEISAADIVSMRRRPDGWWVQIGPELEGMLIGLEASLGASRF